MNAILKRRMAATQQASELQASDEAYQQIFQHAPPSAPSEICDLPLDKLDSFFTADIGFKPYSPAKLEAFAQQLQEEGLLVRIIVRRIPHSDRYEILAGHNRTAAARLVGWTKIAAEIVVADDARAISIATLTNLLQRQDLSIIERGKAYKVLLEAKTGKVAAPIWPMELLARIARSILPGPSSRNFSACPSTRFERPSN